MNRVSHIKITKYLEALRLVQRMLNIWNGIMTSDDELIDQETFIKKHPDMDIVFEPSQRKLFQTLILVSLFIDEMYICTYTYFKTRDYLSEISPFFQTGHRRYAALLISCRITYLVMFIASDL